MLKLKIQLLLTSTVIVLGVIGCSQKSDESNTAKVDDNAAKNETKDLQEKIQQNFSYSIESMADCSGFYKLIRELQKMKGDTAAAGQSVFSMETFNEALTIAGKKENKTESDVLEMADASYNRYHTLLFSDADKNQIRQTFEETRVSCDKILLEDMGVNAIGKRRAKDLKEEYEKYKQENRGN